MNQFHKKFLLACLVLIIFISVFSPYKFILVQGNSMSPTYKNNQILIATKISNSTKIEKEDVVVIYLESQYILKRVKYKENDFIYFKYILNSNSYELIDKKEYEFIHDKIKLSHSGYSSSSLIEKNKFYLLGDNRNFSDDSRRFGQIDKSNILYKIIYPIVEDPNNGKK